MTTAAEHEAQLTRALAWAGEHRSGFMEVDLFSQTGYDDAGMWRRELWHALQGIGLEFQGLEWRDPRIPRRRAARTRVVLPDDANPGATYMRAYRAQKRQEKQAAEDEAVSALRATHGADISAGARRGWTDRELLSRFQLPYRPYWEWGKEYWRVKLLMRALGFTRVVVQRDRVCEPGYRVVERTGPRETPGQEFTMGDFRQARKPK